MPLWLIKYLIALAFFPALLAGVALLFLAATWMQVEDRRREEEHGKSEHNGRRRTRRGRYQATR